MDDRFLQIAMKTISREGGYVCDSDDPGGATKYGISKRSYPGVDIPALSVDAAIEIYRRDFWVAPNIDRIADCRLAARVFDLGVNMGPRTAIVLLQQALNVLGFSLLEDGRLGAMTLTAANGCPHRNAPYVALLMKAAERYVALDKKKYLVGWLERLGS